MIVTAEPIAANKNKGPWQKHFAWWPVTINNKSYWMTTVYRRRRYVADVRWGHDYGTILDVLKTK